MGKKEVKKNVATKVEHFFGCLLLAKGPVIKNINTIKKIHLSDSLPLKIYTKHCHSNVKMLRATIIAKYKYGQHCLQKKSFGPSVGVREQLGMLATARSHRHSL